MKEETIDVFVVALVGTVGVRVRVSMFVVVVMGVIMIMGMIV